MQLLNLLLVLCGKWKNTARPCWFESKITLSGKKGF